MDDKLENIRDHHLTIYKTTCWMCTQPFILNATLMKHLQACIKKKEDKTVVEETHNDLVVNDLTSGGVNKQETQHVKEITAWLFLEYRFTLHCTPI